MADLERTVAILFRGVDEISGTMNTISGSLASFGGNLKAATQPLADIALGAEKATLALAGMAAGGMVVAVTAAGKFQSGLNEIHTLLRESPEAVAGFDQAIESYAINSTQSLEDIQKAIYQSLSANVSYSESIKFVSDAEKLAVAGKSTLTEAVDLLTGTLTAYGESWDQAGKYSDVFFKAVEIGKVTIPELAQSLSLVAPMASTAGVKIEEVSAAIAAMTAGGMKAGPSSEYLRGLISDLIKPAKESQGEFNRLGIEFGATALASSGLSGKLQEIWTKSDGSADVMAKLFGNVTSYTAAVVLSSDKSGYFAKALDEISNSSGSVARAYEIMVNSFELLNTRLANSIKLALIESGKPLLDDWANIADGLGKVFQGVKVGLSDGAFDEIYAEIDKFAVEFGDYLREVAKAVPEAMKDVDFTAFLASIESLGTAVGDLFKALFGDFDLTKPDELAAAIQKVVDAATKLTEFTAGIAESLKPFATEMGNWINKAIDADTETTKLAGKVAGFGQEINTMVTALGFVGPAMAIFSGALVINAVATIGSLGTALIALPAAPVVAVGAALLAVGYGLSTLSPAVNSATTEFDEFGNAIGQFPDYVEPVAKGIGTIMSEMNMIPPLKTFTIDGDTGEATEKVNALSASILSFPPGITIDILTKIDPVGIGTASALMNDMSRTYTADFAVSLNEQSINKMRSTMTSITNPDGTKTWINVGVDAASLEATKKALKEIPTEKQLEIKLQGSIDKELAMIKTGADTVQKAMEWTAKMNIAQVQADAEMVKASLGSISETTKATSAEISSLFSNRPKSIFDAGATEWFKQVEQDLKIQRERWEVEKKLQELQIDVIKAKERRLNSKDALIRIDSSGLEPQLEMIMWQILQKVQLKANEENTKFLLGL